MKDQLIPVNIIIADRSYRLKIEAEDEEMVRNTVKILNEKIIDFKTNVYRDQLVFHPILGI